MAFSENVILQLHSVLYRILPQPGGRWKAANNDMVERHPGGTVRVRFRPVKAHLTPMAMADLGSEYRAGVDRHLADPLVLVPLAILDFLCIHPFPDGNGRMAISDIEQACPCVSRDMIRVVLRADKIGGPHRVDRKGTRRKMAAHGAGQIAG